MIMDKIEIIEKDGKKVPVKIEKDAIYSGRLEQLTKDAVYPLDVRRKIIDLANHSEKYIGDGENLDVDHDGKGNFIVNKITKTPLSYEEALDAYQQSIDIEKELYRSLRKESSQEMLDSLLQTSLCLMQVQDHIYLSLLKTD